MPWTSDGVTEGVEVRIVNESTRTIIMLQVKDGEKQMKRGVMMGAGDYGSLQPWPRGDAQPALADHPKVTTDHTLPNLPPTSVKKRVETQWNAKDDYCTRL